MWRPEFLSTFLMFFLHGDLTKKQPIVCPSKKTPTKKEQKFQKRLPLATQLLRAILRYKKTRSLSLSERRAFYYIDLEMTNTRLMRSTHRRRSDTSRAVKKLFLLAFAFVVGLGCCTTNTDFANGLMRGRRRRIIVGEDIEGFFFVSANPTRGKEDENKLLRLERELEKAKSDLSYARKEKRAVEEKLNVDLNEMRRTKREVELELQKSKSAMDEAKVNLEKTKEEKEKFERSFLRETKEEFIAQKSSSNDLKTEFAHFWEALKTFAEAATSDGKAKAKEGLEGLKAHSKVFAEYLKEKTSGLAVVAKAKGSEYYAFAKVKSLEIGQLASKKAMEFDLPKKYETAKVKAKKEVMPKIKSAYGEVTKQVKSGVKKVQPQLTKAKKFVQEKTPKEAKEYATRAFLFLTAAREELVKVLAAKLLMVYQNVDFFAPYATKSNAMFSSYVLVQTLMYYLAYRTVSRVLFGRKKAKGDNNNKNVTKKAAKAVPKEVKGRSVEFSPPKTRATRIAAPFAAKRTTA